MTTYRIIDDTDSVVALSPIPELIEASLATSEGWVRGVIVERAGADMLDLWNPHGPTPRDDTIRCYVEEVPRKGSLPLKRH